MGVQFISGPDRVKVGDDDPDFVAPPLLGFSTGINHQTRYAANAHAAEMDFNEYTWVAESLPPLEDQSHITRGEN